MTSNKTAYFELLKSAQIATEQFLVNLPTETTMQVENALNAGWKVSTSIVWGIGESTFLNFDLDNDGKRLNIGSMEIPNISSN